MRRDDPAALAEDVADLGVHDEVDVALAVADLAVREAVELLGQRAKGLGEHGERRGRDGELAAARAHDGARRAQDVAEVKLAEKAPGLVTENVVAAEELDGAAHVLEHDEGGLALAGAARGRGRRRSPRPRCRRTASQGRRSWASSSSGAAP